MKDTSIRISGEASKIIEAFLFYKNKQITGKQKLTKRALIDKYAVRLLKQIHDASL